MIPGRPNLGRILVTNAVITENQLETALGYQLSNGCRLGEAMIALNYCSDTDIAHALAEQMEIPYIDLQLTPPKPNLIALMSREMALELGVIPVRMDGSRLVVAALDPCDIRVDEAVRQATNMEAVLAFAPESQLRALLRQYYSLKSYEEPRTRRPEAQTGEIELEQQTQVSVDKLVSAGQQLSSVRVLNTLIVDAARAGASDLHIQPEETCVHVRYRVDGTMCSIVTLQRDVLESLVARIKIVCGMDISENRRPQDGGCRMRLDNRPVELRSSTLPGVFGESIVLRIASRDASLQRLENLGFEDAMADEFRRLLGEKHGMILVTGPTGSGKTTSLYAALNYVNNEDIKVLTVEDPVEVKLPDMVQVQVEERGGRSFANALRAMLRHDPDVIMVGEMRDTETADIACRAALTGHLVLSTLHTRSACGTLARLYDMGIAPYTISAALNGIMAQRLVRRVCDNCGVEKEPSAGLREYLETRFGKAPGATFRAGTGCASCRGTGVKGRVGVYELLAIDEHIRKMIIDAASPTEIEEYARSQGFDTVEADAFRKARRGIVPIEEVLDLGLGSLSLRVDEGPEIPVDAAEVEERPAMPAAAGPATREACTALAVEA
jgi:type IV pilus assembly protein PilB